MSGESHGLKSKYFVAFDYWKENNIYGRASTIVERELPVSDWDDILSITEGILFDNPDMEKISISNWRKFEDPE
jgi:hypothetical protein